MPRLPLPKFLRGSQDPAEAPDAGFLSDGREPDQPPLDLAGSASSGALEEAAETARLEAELDIERMRLTGTLRAVLAERMVRAPTTEFEAVQVPDKDRLKEAREARRTASSRDGDGLNPAAVIAARKRLDTRLPGKKRQGKRK